MAHRSSLALAKTVVLPLPAEIQPMGKTHTCRGNLPAATLSGINNFTHTCICSNVKDNAPSERPSPPTTPQAGFAIKG